MSERWKILDRTSASGKRLFECQSCGRVSATPDRLCLVPQCESYSAHHEAEAMRKLEELSERFRRLAGG